MCAKWLYKACDFCIAKGYYPVMFEKRGELIGPIYHGTTYGLRGLHEWVSVNHQQCSYQSVEIPADE